MKKLFGRRPASSPEQKPTNHDDPAKAALMRTIAERRSEDPLIGAKIGAKEVNARLMNAMKTDKGVHVETLLYALGSLAGYSCQASLRAQAIEKGMPEESAFNVVGEADGERHFFGDPLNQLLAETQYSVWSLAAGGAQQAGCGQLPDINQIFAHVSKSLGSDQFGVPQTPDQHRAPELPIAYLKSLWPMMFPLAKEFCAQPVEWPVLFGLAAQEIIISGKAAIDPCMAVKVVMECAVPMSKVDLAMA